MGLALGIEELAVGAEGRITASRLIRQYLESYSLKEKESKPEVVGYIGLAVDIKEKKGLPALVLYNNQYIKKIKSTEKSKKVKQENENILAIPSEESEYTNQQKQSGKFDPVVIKSGKIQLKAKHLDRLGIDKNTPKDKRRVVIRGLVYAYMIWSKDEFAKRFPEEYKELEAVSDEEQQVP